MRIVEFYDIVFVVFCIELFCEMRQIHMEMKTVGRSLLAYAVLLLGCVVFLLPFAFSFVSELTPLLRYYTNTILPYFVKYWLVGVCMLISYSSKKATMIMLIFSAFSILLIIPTAIPKYVMMSTLGFINTYFVLIESILHIVALFISCVLFLVTKNRKISYFVSLA